MYAFIVLFKDISIKIARSCNYHCFEVCEPFRNESEEAKATGY
jgi:hypothetical protein